MAEQQLISDFVPSRSAGSRSILLYCNWGVFIDENDTIFVPSVHHRYLIALQRLGYDRIDLMTKVSPARTISCDTQLRIANVGVVRLPWFKNYLGAFVHFFALMRTFIKVTRRPYDRVYIRVFEPFSWLLTFLFSVRDSDFTRHNVVMHFVFDPMGLISSNPYTNWLQKAVLRCFFMPEYWLTLAATLLSRPTCNGPAIRQSFPNFVASRMIVTTESALLREDIPRKEQISQDSGTIKLLYVGYLRSSKGIDVLLKAILKVRRAGAPAFELRIVGSGSYLPQIKGFIERHELGTTIQLVGHVPFSSRLFDEYRQADIFINPSPSETGPRVLLEAKVFGNLLISTDVGYARTIMGGERDAQIVPKNDPDALADAIFRAIELKHSAPDKTQPGQRQFAHGVTAEEFFREVLDEA